MKLLLVKAAGSVMHLVSGLAIVVGAFELFYWAMSPYGWPYPVIWGVVAILALCFGTLVYRFLLSLLLIVLWSRWNSALKIYLRGVSPYGE